MKRYRLAAILLCGAILTGFTGCADSTGRRQTRTEDRSLNRVESTLPAIAGWTSAAPATASNTAEKGKPPETDRKPATEPETASPTPQTSAPAETPATSTAPATSPATFRTPEISTPSPEPSQTPATTQPPLPDTPFVPETTDKPTPTPTQAPDKPSPTPETEPPTTTRPPETGSPQPSRPPEPESPVPDTKQMARMFLEFLNVERAKVGARPLATGDRLRQMAQVRADELTVLFDHDRPNGESSRTIYTEFEYGNRYDYTDLGFGIVYYPAHYGEDIGQTALGEGGGIEEAVRSMTESFRGSPEHWSDLMNPVYGVAGVAVSVERIDMGEDFPALYRCNFEVLLVDRLYE